MVFYSTIGGAFFLLSVFTGPVQSAGFYYFAILNIHIKSGFEILAEGVKTDFTVILMTHFHKHRLMIYNACLPGPQKCGKAYKIC